MAWSTVSSSSLIRGATEGSMCAWGLMNSTSSTWTTSTRNSSWQLWLIFLWTLCPGVVQFIYKNILMKGGFFGVVQFIYKNILMKGGFFGVHSTAFSWSFPTATSKYIWGGKIKLCQAQTRKRKLWGEGKGMLLLSSTTCWSGWWN